MWTQKLDNSFATAVTRNNIPSCSPLWVCLEHWASLHPDRNAVFQGDRRTTYATLNRAVLAVNSSLRRTGLQPGERVAILCDNSAECIAAYFGVQREGGVVVALNTQYTAFEIERILRHARVSLLITDKKYVSAARKAANGILHEDKVLVVDEIEEMGGRLPDMGDPASTVRPSMDDLAAIIYTSGTTGRPKGVMLTHRNFCANASSIVSYLGLSVTDKVMTILPFYYSYGMSLLTTHLMVGGTLVLENSFMYPNKVLNTMESEEVTGFAGVPTTFAILLNKSNIRNRRFPALRYLTQAGGPMSPQHAKTLKEILPDTRVFIMYGQTEATARLTYLEPEDLHRKLGSIGKAIPGVTIQVIKDDGTLAGADEEGEIVAHGDNIMAGYWDNPAETAKVLRGGKLHTGDRAKTDEEGYLYIVGRSSDMIKSGAHRISPKEIEEVIQEMNAVHEVALIGVPDEILGEAIRALVVLKDGHSCDQHAVQKHCRAKLAQFKIPREVFFVESLPKTSTGKVQRFLLKEKYGK